MTSNEQENRIRKATQADIPRLAEILIFAKRMAYRPIFCNDHVSFNEMQVVGLAAQLQKDEALEGVVVYDDGIVKGMMRRSDSLCDAYPKGVELCEFFVDPFFQHGGIGGEMMRWLRKESEGSDVQSIFLLVLEKNADAIRFYERFGFSFDGTRVPVPGTEEYLKRYHMKLG